MDIISELVALRRREHESTVAILEGLLVCHRTRRHVDLGYRNLFAFMVEHLDYSKAAASRRLRAVRCAAKFPVVLTWLRERRVSLSALAKVAVVLDRFDSAEALLARVEGCSEDEVERVVARERPVVKPVEKIETVFVKKVERVSMFEVERASVPAEVEPVVAPAAPEPEERVTLKFSITPEQYAAFERARAIVSRKTGRVPTLEECFEEFVGLYLERKGPRETGSAPNRASKPKVDIETSGSVRNQTAVGITKGESGVQPRSRHIPKPTRDAVMIRDDHRCTYIGPDGHRCTARTNLQIDHIEPFARGGTHDATNLRVLCAEHNRRAAELAFGPLSDRTARRNGKSRESLPV